MPAVTADTLTLARISTPGAEVTDRSVRSVTTAPSGFEGEGFLFVVHLPVLRKIFLTHSS